MPSIFPASPTANQIVTNSRGTSFKYDATNGVWSLYSGSGSGSSAVVTASATAPTTPNLGDHWYSTTDNTLYLRVNDGSAAVWIDISNSGGGSGSSSYTQHGTTFPVPTAAGQIFIYDTTGDRYVSVQDVVGYSWVQETSAGTASGLGYNQTWQDLTASRAVGTTYTNTTGKPIMVAYGWAGGFYNTFTVNGVNMQGPTVSNIGGYYIIPPGAIYGVTVSGGGSLSNWFELR